MFCKISRFSPLSQTLKQFGYFSSLPVVYKYVKNPKIPESRLIFRSMLANEINDVSDLIADVYIKRENVIRSLNLPKDQFSEVLKKDLIVAQENDLAIVCRDEKSNKLAGAFYAQDLRLLIDEKNLLTTNEAQEEKWLQFEDFYKYCFLYVDQFAMPKGLNDIIFCKRIAVEKEYSQLNVGNNLMYTARFLHPKMTKFNRYLIIATHEYTYNFCKINGFELIKKISYKSIRDRSNKKPFEKMVKLDGRTEADEWVYVMKRETEGNTFFQDIKAKK